MSNKIQNAAKEAVKQSAPSVDEVTKKMDATAETLKDVNPELSLSTKVNSNERKRKGLAKKYTKEKKVSVRISPQYRPWFGKNAHISMNGISVAVPCDGRDYMVPKAHAALILGTINKIDYNLSKQTTMSNVKGNEDAADSPGTVKMS